MQRGEEIPDAAVEVLNQRGDLGRIHCSNGSLEIGALITFEEVAHHPAFRALVPDIESFMFLIASLQIRNRATLSGNVVNASPIGDMTILLLALDAKVCLARGNSTRTVDLRSFYRGYKVLDKESDEILTGFPFALSGEFRKGIEANVPGHRHRQ